MVHWPPPVQGDAALLIHPGYILIAGPPLYRALPVLRLHGQLQRQRLLYLEGQVGIIQGQLLRRSLLRLIFFLRLVLLFGILLFFIGSRAAVRAGGRLRRYECGGRGRRWSGAGRCQALADVDRRDHNQQSHQQSAQALGGDLDRTFGTAEAAGTFFRADGAPVGGVALIFLRLVAAVGALRQRRVIEAAAVTAADLPSRCSSGLRLDLAMDFPPFSIRRCPNCPPTVTFHLEWTRNFPFLIIPSFPATVNRPPSLFLDPLLAFFYNKVAWNERLQGALPRSGGRACLNRHRRIVIQKTPTKSRCLSFLR